MKEVCFATITSTGYIDQTAGLYLNLKEVHPDVPLVVCTLDDKSYRAFDGTYDGLTLVKAETVWGKPFWHNLCCRSTRPELAFASKAATVSWALENIADTVIVLDSDLLFMTPTPDLIDRARSHDMLLMAARHSLENWRKSNAFGLFSAGIVGISKAGYRAAQIWKSQCFDECRPLPADGLFNEQKYLDYFVGFFDVDIVRDPGINVSATILNLVQPEQDEDRRWWTRDGTMLRIFHDSRTTSSDIPLSQMKQDFNARGLEHFSLGQKQAAGAKKQPSNTRFFSLSRLFRLFRLGNLYTSFSKLLPIGLRKAFTLYRVLTLSEFTLANRYSQAFKAKVALNNELRAKAFTDGDSKGPAF